MLKRNADHREAPGENVSDFPSQSSFTISRRMVFGAILLTGVLSVCWGVIGCQRAASDSDSKAPVTESTTAVAGDRRLQDNLQVESFAKHATLQLKAIGKLLGQPGKLDTEHLAPYTAPNFSCAPLRPAKLQKVFRDQAFVVFRAADGSASVASEPSGLRHGPAGLADALRALALPDASDMRVKFKLYQVEPRDTSIATAAYFQAVGQTSRGRVQQNAIWHCQWIRDETATAPQLAWIEVQNYEEVVVHGTNKPLFSDCTESVLAGNISFNEQLRRGNNHWIAQLDGRVGLDVSNWVGLALGDVNNDGLDDVYVCQPVGLPNRLFVQNQDGTATDVTQAAGVDFLDSISASLLVDLDNDGDQDLLVAVAAGVLFLANDGSGRFTLKATKVTPQAVPQALTAADYDHDGDLDIFICCYRPRPQPGNELRDWALPIPYHDANNGARNMLLRNDGNWRFRYATRQAGLGENNQRFSFAAAWEDYDNDGDSDLYVANDYGRNNLYRNENGRFQDVAAEAGVEDISAGMSACWGDYNNDGWMDLYVSNMFSAAGNRVTYQRTFKTAADNLTRTQFQRHARGNSLFQNAADGTFRDVSRTEAVTMGRWAWGSRFFDINNDGWEDLLITNGFVTQDNPDDL